MSARTDPSSPTRALADFAFGTHTQVADASRPLAWLSPEELEIDLAPRATAKTPRSILCGVEIVAEGW